MRDIKESDWKHLREQATCEARLMANVGRPKASLMNEPWQEFAAYADAVSAGVAAGLLRSEGVPVDVVSDEPMPGLVQGFRLMVSADMLHRARWVVSNADFTEEELAFLATGRLGSSEEERDSGVTNKSCSRRARTHAAERRRHA